MRTSEHTALTDDLSQELRTIKLQDRRTSIRMEARLWRAFDDILLREQVSTSDLMAVLDQRRGQNSLTAALRVFITAYFHALANAHSTPSASPILQDSKKGRNDKQRLKERIDTLDINMAMEEE